MLVAPLQQTSSLSVRGRVGFSAAAGFARCGYSRCAAPADFGGVYQRKKTLNGWRTSRMRYYRPANPQTTAQQAWRATFALGISGYQALTPEQKNALKIEARKYRLGALSLYMRRYLQANR